MSIKNIRKEKLKLEKRNYKQRADDYGSVLEHKEVIDCLNEEERKCIEETDILEWFKKNSGRYDNIRLLKTRIDNAVYDELTEIYIFNDNEQENS